MRIGFERCILAEFFSCEVLEVEYMVEQSPQPLKCCKTPLLARSKQLLQTSLTQAFRSCLVSTGISSPLCPTSSVGQSLLWPHISALLSSEKHWHRTPGLTHGQQLPTFAASRFCWSPFCCALVTAVYPPTPKSPLFIETKQSDNCQGSDLY